MDDRTAITVVAMTCITVLGIVAIGVLGIDSGLVVFLASVISGLAGHEIGKKRRGKSGSEAE